MQSNSRPRKIKRRSKKSRNKSLRRPLLTRKRKFFS